MFSSLSFPSLLVRTPLNTIKLSIHLLSKNLLRFQDIISRFPSSSLPHHDPNKMNSLSELHQIIEESLELLVGLDENSSMSVTTLNDLINYDRIETNNFGIEKNDVAIWPLIEKTIQSLNFLAKEKNIRMGLTTQISNPSEFAEAHLDLHNLYVIGDCVKLEQVIRNLVSNAVKYTPIDGEVKISGTVGSLPLMFDHLSL
jgi:signal transduction histidine kinase